MIPHQWPRVIQSKKDYVQHQRDVYGPIQLNSVDDYISEQHHGDIAPKSYGKEELLTYIARQSKQKFRYWNYTCGTRLLAENCQASTQLKEQNIRRILASVKDAVEEYRTFRRHMAFFHLLQRARYERRNTIRR